MYKIAQEKKPVRTHLLNFMVEGMVALNTAHYRAEDEKSDFWQKMFMDEQLKYGFCNKSFRKDEPLTS